MRYVIVKCTKMVYCGDNIGDVSCIEGNLYIGKVKVIDDERTIEIQSERNKGFGHIILDNYLGEFFHNHFEIVAKGKMSIKK